MGVQDDHCSMDDRDDLHWMGVPDVQGDLYWLGDLDALVSMLPMVQSIQGQGFLQYNLPLPLRN
jgi:hypothetical protein